MKLNVVVYGLRNGRPIVGFSDTGPMWSLKHGGVSCLNNSVIEVECGRMRGTTPLGTRFLKARPELSLASAKSSQIYKLAGHEVELVIRTLFNTSLMDIVNDAISFILEKSKKSKMSVNKVFELHRKEIGEFVGALVDSIKELTNVEDHRKEYESVAELILREKAGKRVLSSMASVEGPASSPYYLLELSGPSDPNMGYPPVGGRFMFESPEHSPTWYQSMSFNDVMELSNDLVDNSFVFKSGDKWSAECPVLSDGETKVFLCASPIQDYIEALVKHPDFAPDLLEEATQATLKLNNSLGNSLEHQFVKGIIGKYAESYLKSLHDLSKSSSVIDYPRSSLDSKVWDDGSDLLPKHSKKILQMLDKGLKKFGYTNLEGGDEHWISDVLLVGSLTTYQYLSTSDADCHIQTHIQDFKRMEGLDVSDEQANGKLQEVAKYLNGLKETLEGTSHPMEFFFENEMTTPSQYTGIYSLFNDEWVEKSVSVDLDFDINEVKKAEVEAAYTLMSDMDLDIGEADRKVGDAMEFVDAMGSWPEDKRNLANDKLSKKIDSIEKELLELIGKGKQVRVDRKQYSKFSVQEVKFKFLQKFGYMSLVKKLEKILDKDRVVTEDNLPEIKDVLESKGAMPTETPFGSEGPNMNPYFEFRNYQKFQHFPPSAAHLFNILKLVGVDDIPEPIKNKHPHIKQFENKFDVVNNGKVVSSHDNLEDANIHLKQIFVNKMLGGNVVNASSEGIYAPHQDIMPGKGYENYPTVNLKWDQIFDENEVIPYHHHWVNPYGVPNWKNRHPNELADGSPLSCPSCGGENVARV